MAAKINLAIETGVTFTKTFVWKKEDQSRRSLAGLRAKMQIREKVGAPVLVELTSADGHLILEGTEVEGSSTGVFVLNIPGPMTMSIKKPNATYDIRFETVSTEDHEPSYRPVDGDIEFDLAVTK